MGSSSILVYERLLLLASLDTDSDNTEKVFLSLESIKSNKWLNDFGIDKLYSIKGKVLARNEYFFESIPVHDA